MRGKEEAHDYRYFPDPDLAPLVISPEWLEEVRATLPELPDAKKARFMAQYDLPEYDAGVLTGEKALAAFFEDCINRSPEPKPKPKTISNWIMSELMRELKKEERGIQFSATILTPATSASTANLLSLVEKGTISGKIAKTIYPEIIASGKDPEELIKEKGLIQISDSGSLEALARDILAANPKEVADYKAGKTKVMGFFVGEIMKKTKGQANPKVVNQLLSRLLKE
jgi:aspartyl-tRNA(Asn)/glutamyl-tRNA(Gln) amidotransferase subunit B